MRYALRRQTAAIAVMALFLMPACASTPRTAVQRVADYGARFTKLTEDAQKMVIASALPNDNKAKAMVVFKSMGDELQRVGSALLVIDGVAPSGVTISEGQKSQAIGDVTKGIAVLRNLLRSGLIPIAANDAAVAQVLTLFSNIDGLFVQLETSLAELRRNQS